MLPRAVAPRGIATPFDSFTSRTTRAVTGWRRWHDFVLSGVSRRSHKTVPAGRVAPGCREPAGEAWDGVGAPTATPDDAGEDAGAAETAGVPPAATPATRGKS